MLGAKGVDSVLNQLGEHSIGIAAGTEVVVDREQQLRTMLIPVQAIELPRQGDGDIELRGHRGKKLRLVVDLAQDPEAILAAMHEKWRYNIRLAEKKGVSVRVGTLEDLPMLSRMYAETSVRDGFVIREEGYYKTVWNLFMNSNDPHCEPLIAEVDNEPVAAIFIFYFAGRAYYVYGMSRDVHREKMPAYLLQWEAMKRAKANGCETYDLWGAPDVFNESDSMWGVYRFKEGLGGKVVRTLGAWDYAPNRLWYNMYSEVIPRVLDVMRSRGKAKTKQSLGGA